ncbi:ketosteroid isomerase-like protein [Catenulispora sp. MAP5-51]|uniref:nuclear transport factor 2 family protein n=1 Tax=Catenulispora sp. MAP5-51 TaxID=3156298 RepID=UPI003519D4B9
MSSTVSATPADLLERRRRLILDGDADGFAALFAPDAVIEVPFAGTPEAPMRLEGRPAILEYARHAMASLLRLEELEVSSLYETQDPEVVVAEVRASGTVTTTGRSFSVTAVQILRIRDGLITLFRDYADQRVLAEVTAA